jgi:GT2 family glycosyltransferase
MTFSELIYIVIPVHNRCNTTMMCLEMLNRTAAFDQCHVIVVDDGSTDGTTKAIQATYPQVILLAGDGHLWWTGAISLGMRYAYDHGADYILWLNDDTLPQAGAIALLIHACRQQPQTIVGAQCYQAGDRGAAVPSFGGQRMTPWGFVPVAAQPTDTIACDVLNGNLVCLPRAVIDAIGYPPGDRVPHYGGDFAYTLDARRAGWTLQLLGAARASSTIGPGDSSWLLSDTPIRQRWQHLRSPKSLYYIPGYWDLCVRVWGIWGILIFVQPYVRLSCIGVLRWMVPRPWLKALKSRKG